VVKITVFLRHMSDFPRMNDAYVEELGDHRPARTTIGVAELPLNALVEIEAMAYRP
jgi:2-iminobutanoate/2-iminopropanoate deaminase